MRGVLVVSLSALVACGYSLRGAPDGGTLPNLLLEACATDVVGTVVGLDDNRDGEVMVVLWGVR